MFHFLAAMSTVNPVALALLAAAVFVAVMWEGLKISGGVAPKSLLDLVDATLDEQPRMKFTETMGLTDYPLIRLFFDTYREKITSGIGLTWSLRLRTNGSFQFVRLFQITANNQVQVMGRASAIWAMFEGKMIIDERQDDFNSGQPEQLYDMITAHESAMYEDVIAGIDTSCGQAPNNISDDLSLLGLPYWLPPLGTGLTAPTGAFSGNTAYFRDGSSTTLIGGLDASDALNERHKSYVHTWSGRVDALFYEALRRCMTRTNFKMLPELKGKTRRGAGQRNLLAGHDISDAIERYANANDPQGADPMRFQNDSITIRGVKPIRVPIFDSLWPTSVFGTYSKHIFGNVHKTRWMKRRTYEHGDNPNVVITQLDGTCQITCDDRQKAGFHLHTPR